MAEQEIPESHCLNVRIVYQKQIPPITDGEFCGKWTAYRVSFSDGNNEFLVETRIGCRGLDCPCKVIVKNGFIVSIE